MESPEEQSDTPALGARHFRWHSAATEQLNQAAGLHHRTYSCLPLDPYAGGKECSVQLPALGSTRLRNRVLGTCTNARKVIML